MTSANEPIMGVGLAAEALVRRLWACNRLEKLIYPIQSCVVKITVHAYYLVVCFLDCQNPHTLKILMPNVQWVKFCTVVGFL